MATAGFMYRLKWGNPYTKSPNGIQVIAEMFESNDQRSLRMSKGEPSVPLWLSAMHVPGDGYSVYVIPVTPPIQPISKEARSKIRKSRLTKRIEKKYPLFSSLFIQEELAKRPDYFAGEYDPETEAARNDALNSISELYNRFLLETDQL